MLVAAVAPVYLECVVDRPTRKYPFKVTIDEQNQSVIFEDSGSNFVYRLPATFSASTVSFIYARYGNGPAYQISRVDLSVKETFPEVGQPWPGKCSMEKVLKRAF
ncbi:C-type lysozyme inhibitor domain-containing protein [Bordetella sputigena]